MTKSVQPSLISDATSGQVYCVSFVGDPANNHIMLTPVDDVVELPTIPGIESVGPENSLSERDLAAMKRDLADHRSGDSSRWHRQFFFVAILGALVLTVGVLAIGWVSASAAVAQTPIGSLKDVARQWDILYVRTWPLAFALMALGLVSLLFSPRKG